MRLLTLNAIVSVLCAERDLFWVCCGLMDAVARREVVRVERNFCLFECTGAPLLFALGALPMISSHSLQPATKGCGFEAEPRIH